jgi:hypothetical protein
MIMKVKYKGLEGIAALKLKVADQKKKALPAVFQRKELSSICEFMGLSGNRRSRREETRRIMKENQ